MKSKEKANKNIKQKNKDLISKDSTELKFDKSSQIENKRNIERFIYITNYSNINSVIKINQLFEDINSSAFNITEKNDIISKTLDEEEQNNNEIDYISGFQIMDNKLRITIIEGITGKAMEKVKQTLPKNEMNSENFKIFSDKSILYDKRIYSKFNLVIKYIKLRKNLNEILTTFEIYMEANRYRNIYDTFMNFGAILRADTMSDISSSNSFPDADKLIELERKYGDVLTEEDLTGIKKVKKYNNNIKNLLLSFDDANIESIKTNIISNNSLKFNNSFKKTNLVKSMKLMPIKKKVKFIEKKDENSLNNRDNNNCLGINNKRYFTLDINENGSNINYDNNKKEEKFSKSIDIDINNFINFKTPNKKNKFENNRYNSNESDDKKSRLKIKLCKKPKVYSKNIIFMKILKEREEKKITPLEIFNKNKKYLNIMKKKKSYVKFCQPLKGEYNNKKEILFNPSKINHYAELVNEMRKKYINDKDHYYSYSENKLTLSFPMIEAFRNEEYLKYLENKSRWIVEKDFDRYKQPEREKIFFPKIIKEI